MKVITEKKNEPAVTKLGGGEVKGDERTSDDGNTNTTEKRTNLAVVLGI